MSWNSMEYTAWDTDTETHNNKYNLLEVILVKGLKHEQKKIAEAKPKMSPILCQTTGAAPEFWRRLRLFLLWLTDMSAAEQPSTAAEKRKKKEKNHLMWGSGLFVLWFDFCGSQCRRNATKRGIFNNLPRQTVWRHMLLKPGHIHLFQRFHWTPTVSLKMESCSRVNRLPDPNMTGCGMTCKRTFEVPVITRPAALSQRKAESIDLSRSMCQAYCFSHFLKL